MIKNAGEKEKILKVNRSGKYFCTDRINLFVQFWFKFENKKHFKDQTVQFTQTFLQNLENYFSGIRILSLLVLHVFTWLPIVDRLCSSTR